MSEKRRSTIVCILLLGLAGCTMPMDWSNYPEQHDDLMTAWRATAELAYMDDPPGGYWKSPRETERDGGGDCEDLATFMIYRLGPEAALVITYNHAVVEYRGQLIEAQYMGSTYPAGSLRVRRRISYYLAMELATDYGRK
jgi:hypothetical protein